MWIETGLVVDTGHIDFVAPHMGVWVKIWLIKWLVQATPYARVWIKTVATKLKTAVDGSLPMRKRGLKSNIKFITTILLNSLSRRSVD